MIRLLELRDGTARPVLPEGRDPAGWHQAVSQEIAAHLTPEHAALLATPVRGEASVVWFAPGTALRRYGELEAVDRDRLTAAAGAILSDIRRLAESGTAPLVTAAWPALRTVPDLAHLFAVDGRPMLAGWGFAALAGGAGPMAGFDDGIAWRAPPRLAWPVYGGMLAALAGLALFAGLVLVPLGALMQPSPAICRDGSRSVGAAAGAVAGGGAVRRAAGATGTIAGAARRAGLAMPDPARGGVRAATAYAPAAARRPAGGSLEPTGPEHAGRVLEALYQYVDPKCPDAARAAGA